VTDQFCHADRRTDMTKLIVALRNFANVPNNEGLQFFVRPTGWPATGPVSARLRLAHSHLNYAVPFFLPFDHLGSVLPYPLLDRDLHVRHVSTIWYRVMTPLSPSPLFHSLFTQYLARTDNTRANTGKLHLQKSSTQKSVNVM
jgi:hypothetical protein